MTQIVRASNHPLPELQKSKKKKQFFFSSINPAGSSTFDEVFDGS